jgi:hypothetical protein
MWKRTITCDESGLAQLKRECDYQSSFYWQRGYLWTERGRAQQCMTVDYSIERNYWASTQRLLKRDTDPSCQPYLQYSYKATEPAILAELAKLCKSGVNY